MKPIKGYIPNKDKKQDTSAAESMLGTVALFNDLKNAKEDVIKSTNDKLEQVGSALAEVQKTTKDNTKKIDDKIAEVENVAVGMIKDIQSLPQLQGLPGKDAEPVDKEKMKEEILSKIPAPKEIDIKALTQTILKSIPENKASLKVIRETFSANPLEVAKQIMSLPEGQFTLKVSHIAGLDKLLRSIQVSGSKPYIHGGGFNNIYSSSTLVSNGLTGLNFTGSGVTSVTKNATTGIITVSISGGSSGLTVGTTTITSGTSTRILYDNAGVLGEYTISGSGMSVAMSTSPTFSTSITGSYLTPSQILITDGSRNIISATTVTYPSLTELSYVKGVTSSIQTQIDAKGSGTVTTVSVATANGFSGTVANATTTPAITIIAGAITPTSVNGLTITTTTGILTITNGKTLSVAKSLTLDGTDSTTMTFPSTSATIARTDAAQTFTDTQTFSQTILTANAIAAVANAATVPVTSKNNIVTNNSAATLTITLTTASAVNMQDCIVQILDFSGVAQTITWVNTENSTATAPTTSNGSTTLPLTVGFKYNSLTSKWRCVASS